MKIKMVGEVFEAIPETAAELEYLLTSARRDRHCFGQGDMPSVKSYFGSRGEFEWAIDKMSPEG